MPFTEQRQLSYGAEYGIDRVLAADDGRYVILFPAPQVQRAGALNRLELEQPAAEGQLGVQTELAYLGIVLNQVQFTPGRNLQLRGRLPVGAVEHAQTQVQRAETVAVA